MKKFLLAIIGYGSRLVVKPAVVTVACVGTVMYPMTVISTVACVGTVIGFGPTVAVGATCFLGFLLI